MTYWHNGAFFKDDKAALLPSDRALLGDGVFDTLLVENGKAVHGPAHMERLTRHAGVIGIKAPYSPEYLLDVIPALLQENDASEGRYAVKTILTFGPGVRGLDIPENPEATALMLCAPAPKPDDKSLVKLAFSIALRRNEHSPLSRIKHLNYSDNRLAKEEAMRQGADDAIILNTAGHIACASTSNVFARIKGKLLTPPLIDGVIDGVIRAQFMRENRAAEQSLKPEDLSEAEEIFLTNSVTGVRRASMLCL